MDGMAHESSSGFIKYRLTAYNSAPGGERDGSHSIDGEVEAWRGQVAGSPGKEGAGAGVGLRSHEHPLHQGGEAVPDGASIPDRVEA